MTERTSRAEAERFLSLPSEAESLVEGDCFSFADRVATDSKRLAEDYIAVLDENDRLRQRIDIIMPYLENNAEIPQIRHLLERLAALHAADAPGAGDGEVER